jgi:site-specific recombinase XerD
MPSLKFVIRKDVINDSGQSNIKLQVSHRHKIAHIATPYYCKPGEINKSGWITGKSTSQTSLNGALGLLYKEYTDAIAEIGPEIRDLPIQSLVARLKVTQGQDLDFFVYTRERIARLKKEKRYSVAELYEYTRKHLQEYRVSETLLFKEITPSLLMGFEKHLRSGGASNNTLRNYMCNIRAIFNHAINDNKVKREISPFFEYRILRIEKKKPKAIDIPDIKRLIQVQSYLTRAQQRDLDIFFLIFYTGGTNLKDLLYLKHGSFYKDRIIYDRFKTGREYSIRIFPEAKEIRDRYQGKKYLLSFIEKKNAITPADRAGYECKDLLKNVNKNLKQVGKQCGIQLPLRTYVARYSFATIASKLGISKDIIAHILGHGENTMTDLYIDFNEEAADLAIRQVIDSLKS